jgi:hypothetical protein
MPLSSMLSTRKRSTASGVTILCVAALLLAVSIVYRPGLTGGFVLDDDVNIVNNNKLAIESLDGAALTAAFWSGDAGPLGRPVSMISFALNYYFTGFAPYWFKLTNLVIHLINVVLVFWLAKTLLTAFAGTKETRFPHLGALFAAALWGIHPLNLTGVLYVVQRMTSLSALFGLLALAIYATWRAAPKRFSLLGNGSTWLVIGLSLVASVFSKESGLLFIPLLLWVELMVFRGERDGQAVHIGRFTLRQVLCGLCVLGALVALVLLPAQIRPESFYNRDFTMPERAMTETRVLFFYLRLFFAPSLSALGLYHDDFVISTGLLQPATTLVAILGLVAITVAAFVVARKWPMWLFAWGWFLISHAMESTVFSLELVFEHRNYFATIGFVLLIPWLVWRATPKIRRFAPLAAGVFVAMCAFITWQRALVWATPLSLAAFEAEAHPRSERANFELGYTYGTLLDLTGDEKYAELAKAALLRTLDTYNAGVVARFALLRLMYLANETPDPAFLRAIEANLRESPLRNSSVQNLSSFATCQIKNVCHMPHEQAVALFVAAIENPRTNDYLRSEVYKILAKYFVALIADFEKGEEFMNDAIRAHEDVNGRYLLAQILRQDGKLDAAREQIELARRLDTKKVWQAEIAKESALIEQAETGKDAPAGAAPKELRSGADSR